jgi:hypothetical protein
MKRFVQGQSRSQCTLFPESVDDFNNRDKNFTERKLEARKEQLEASVHRYLTA